MRDDGHIDPALFELFVASGVFRRYAQCSLEPAQLDEVDVQSMVRPANAGATSRIGGGRQAQ